ncbi:MAG TPA: HD domain-containing phosphohydrolase, partial [Solirubrobacteraceae bacterium]|nr:HD domain-containing phosphohydrolase [Solirubrobacteraceae bacterium]
RAVDVLRADHAGTIVYDVQFSQPTVEREDSELYEAISRAGGVVLATSESGPGGETDVLGGNANLARARATAAAANFRPNSSGVLQKYSYSIGGLRTIAVTAAEHVSGRRLSPGAFEDGDAWIDFSGPPGTIPAVSFSDLLEGRVRPSQVAGKIVVIGATAPILHDVHATSVTSSTGMPGAEVQAAAITTALQGNPLRRAPAWLTLLTIVLAGIATPLSALAMRPARALLLSLLLGGSYLLLAQLAFEANLILTVTYPLFSLGLGTLGALLVGYAAETWARQLADRYAVTLEARVRERTAELSATQLDVMLRLARAAELRDEDTGAHIERVGRMCEQLALEVGMPAAEAEQLKVASTLHDVGKIGVADEVLLKRGELDDEQWAAMRAHTHTGADLLAGSDSPLLQMAEVIARTHHERWDGSGYPDGLRGEEIPLVGRICSICDVFDALSAPRPYKDSWPFEQVVGEIVRKGGSQFDPNLTQAFERIAGRFRCEHELASRPRRERDGEPGLDVRADSREPARMH